MSSVDASKLRKRYNTFSRTEYQAILEEVVRDIDQVLRPLSVRFQIKHRIKEFGGYLKKLHDIETGNVRAEAVTDMVGVRVICPFLDDLDAVQDVLVNNFTVCEIDHKRHGRSFREFGYDATHLLIDLKGCVPAHPLPRVAAVAEIQLRTILQDAWAEVEHELVYKSDWSIPSYQIRRKLAALNANLTLSDIIFQELREFQRQILIKQDKRRKTAEKPPGSLAKTDTPSRLLNDMDAEIHDDLEKLVISALSAHSEESFDKAIRLYSRALKMPLNDKMRSILLNHRGMAYVALGDDEMSRSDYLSSINVDPNNHRAWFNLGQVYKSTGNLDGALAAFTKCMEINPLFIDAGEQKVILLMEIGDRKTASQVLSDLKQQRPDYEGLSSLQAELDADSPSEP